MIRHIHMHKSEWRVNSYYKACFHLSARWYSTSWLLIHSIKLLWTSCQCTAGYKLSNVMGEPVWLHKMQSDRSDTTLRSDQRKVGAVDFRHMAPVFCSRGRTFYSPEIRGSLLHPKCLPTLYVLSGTVVINLVCGDPSAGLSITVFCCWNVRRSEKI